MIGWKRAIGLLAAAIAVVVTCHLGRGAALRSGEGRDPGEGAAIFGTVSPLLASEFHWIPAHRAGGMTVAGDVRGSDRDVAAAPETIEAGQRLIAAYPDHLDRVEGNDLVWRDGTRMPIDDGIAGKSPQDRLARPDLKDMFYTPYPTGPAGLPPATGADPGRVRHAAFFGKLYGNCEAGTVERHLVEIVWMPRTRPQKLKVSRVNGVAQKLEAVSRELETLPAAVRSFLVPAAGTYVCRPIAGTGRGSAHGYGIAIDIALARSDYWRWSGGRRTKPETATETLAWKNRIPLEIVDIFERHGFIWGGKWYHFDTMHFEYRPELLAPTVGR